MERLASDRGAVLGEYPMSRRSSMILSRKVLCNRQYLPAWVFQKRHAKFFEGTSGGSNERGALDHEGVLGKSLGPSPWSKGGGLSGRGRGANPPAIHRTQ